MKICVHTVPGYQGVETPHVFYLGGHRLLVAGILESWTDHPNRYFQVVTDDGRRFLLRHDLTLGAWQLAAVYGPTRPSPRAVATGLIAGAPARRRWWPAFRKA